MKIFPRSLSGLPPNQTPGGSGVLVQHAHFAHVRKAWLPFFRIDGKAPVTSEAFLQFASTYLPHEDWLDLPVLTGEDLHSAALAQKATSCGLDG